MRRKEGRKEMKEKRDEREDGEEAEEGEDIEKCMRGEEMIRKQHGGKERKKWRCIRERVEKI